jgi:hypothetical protein
MTTGHEGPLDGLYFIAYDDAGRMDYGGQFHSAAGAGFYLVQVHETLGQDPHVLRIVSLATVAAQRWELYRTPEEYAETLDYIRAHLTSEGDQP